MGKREPESLGPLEPAEKVASALWFKKCDMSHVKSICWGTENVAVARDAYERERGHTVKICGIFISRRRPLFAASPDGIFQDSRSGENILIEIKCPFALKYHDLTPPLPSPDVLAVLAPDVLAVLSAAAAHAARRKSTCPMSNASPPF